jgi:hypothetical protein
LNVTGKSFWKWNSVSSLSSLADRHTDRKVVSQPTVFIHRLAESQLHFAAILSVKIGGDSTAQFSNMMKNVRQENKPHLQYSH